jgi:N-acetylmuramoyl-L-alanine amidase
VTRRPALLVAALLAVVALPPAAGLAPTPDVLAERQRQLMVGQTMGLLEVNGARVPIGVTLMPRGPLFSLRTLVERLGGELQVGPLGQSHQLDLAGTTFLFGQESAALTVGQEIVELSQAPVASGDGLRVPLDLVEAIYTELANQQFTWIPLERRLVVGEHSARSLPVAVDVVHLQGVSTVVLQFPTRPRYRVDEGTSRIVVRVVGDRLQPPASVPRSREGMLRGIEFGPHEVTLLLAPNAGIESYELSDPYRLVFDVFPGGAPAAAPGNLPPTRATIPTIVLDPGHGGSDEGARGGSIVEKELTLRLARLLRSKLQAALPVRVVLTRDEDAELPLETRSALANQLKAELFVSLHLNSSFGQAATGAETYFLSLDASDERAQRAADEANQAATAGDPLTDLQLILWDMAQTRHLAESQRLASLIQEELNVTLGLRNRGVKQAPFVVLMGAAMPAVLVEFGFLSNPEEVERLGDPEYQNRLAQALTRALVRYRAAPVSGSAGGVEVEE